MEAATANDEWAALGGPIPPGLGPMPFGPDTMVPPEAFGLAPPAVPQMFKPAPPAPPRVLPELDAVTGAPPLQITEKAPAAAPPAPPPVAAAPTDPAIDVAERAKSSAIEKAYAEAENAADAADFAEAASAERERIAKREQVHVDAARSRHDAAVTRYAGADIKSYWADKTTGDKVVAGFFLAFGALGAGLSAFGGRPTGNLAAEALMRNIDASYRKQVDSIEKMGKVTAMLRTGLQDEVAAKAALLSDHDAKTAAGIKALEARGIATLKARGMPDAEIAGDHAIVELQKRQAELTRKNEIEARREAAELAYLEARTAVANGQAGIAQRKLKGGSGGPAMIPLYDAKGNQVKNPDGTPKMVPKTRATLPNEPSGGKPSDAETKTALYAAAMTAGLDRIEALPVPSAVALAKIQRQGDAYIGVSKRASSPYALSQAAAKFQRWTGMAPTSKYEGLTPQGQQYAQAFDTVKEAALRLVSGAAISDPEDMRAAAQNIPQAGESPAVIRQKFDTLREIAERARKLSGKAGEIIADDKPKTPEQIAAEPAKPGASTRKPGGSTDADLDAYLKSKGL